MVSSAGSASSNITLKIIFIYIYLIFIELDKNNLTKRWWCSNTTIFAWHHTPDRSVCLDLVDKKCYKNFHTKTIFIEILHFHK
ncbi:hypothetical protein GDO86_009770 [Hymenochirus boettgeri]|uniref:Uncharacterized protein n=1 Tax=Hymenochirus boettgeri TaxID=247094 RepID=A0A8T2JHJ0_9PIPI|nr:hypothetical protein GDO86_009770 [Hymenochirus boettgeri]